eukprot:CAMPEP_0113394668 /NCGR_PEP_ID=MMETSP0013_2-20120614/12665_1 /TAXON_ID=2843 ORGANISM="Skeletonema costatum, Strain 1716" /NCGR_SAMPLE_ID=MMETSP0013_2 /ASSEMBLY_ACC=CAM_ASM_000158 /LENGTH=386 /DNA_ID=CAMNT_0000278591 /DNA_START=54 /DNA_END=1214 /DNA_ORIENTATION=- /assembly_acc=CAM_ASM_000158
MASTIDRLGTDELVNIFEYLPPEDIMRTRLNKKMRDAAKKTFVPMTDFVVDSVIKYDAMAAMTTALPHLQQIGISYLHEEGHKYSDGDDPYERLAANTADLTTHDTQLLSNFKWLRSLDICYRPLNGRFPFLFNFTLLHKLNTSGCCYLNWDLESLAGLPQLKELFCTGNESLTGNINSLRVLKDTLAMVDISDCPHVAGNFMDLADFPSHLKCVDLSCTAVTGDIRDIGKQSFQTLELLLLPSGVYGGTGYEFQCISDAPDVVMAVYSIHKQRPSLLKDWYGKLSKDSPDWYDGEDDEVGVDTVPLYIVFVEAGARIGYRWESANDVPNPCEVNWLDPEPDRDSSGYEEYIEELQELEGEVDIYRGFHQPPTEEQYTRLWAAEED